VGHRLHAARLTELRAGGPDHVIAAIADEQFGIVARRQLILAGLGRGAIQSRVRRSGLHPLYAGVYAVGHRALMPMAREMAALLACGPGAVISHRSAGALWRIVDPDGEEDVPVDVTLPRGAGRSRAGLTVHRARRLASDDVRVLRRVPLTAPCRTLLDLAEVVDVRQLESAYGEAIVRRLVSEAALRRMLGNSVGRRGIGPLTRLLDRQAEPSLSRSEAEEKMLALVREAGFPTPQVNVRIHGHLVDFLWRAERVVVEVDGYRFHSSRAAFERDRLRDAELGEAGLWVIRVTWRQLTEEPFAVVARLARALASGRRSPLPK
jgi:very-short-patch-repair endonuclease